MKEKIKKLILLQDCDNKIKEIEAKKEKIPLKIQGFKNIFNKSEMMFKENNDRFESLKKDRRGLEQIVQDLESKAEKSQIKLSNIKSNKEYTAVLKEIEVFEKEKNQNEDKTLLLMEEIEVLEKRCIEERDELAELKNQFDRDNEEIQKELHELDKKAAVYDKQRKDYCDAADRELLKRYLFLKGRKDGIAIGAVVGGICQSCHMEIPPQRFNELRKCNSMMTCSNCNRLVFWGEDDYFLQVLENI
ncbi:C4-type zinc ribbon domain-containing protein [Deltaproteobacteria bacterium]|nr:C4-type zinc ribbon domain-containing protein [Deltaproteobacteria bacterium]